LAETTVFFFSLPTYITSRKNRASLVCALDDESETRLQLSVRANPYCGGGDEKVRWGKDEA
jgi:hypothetical protein